MPEAYIVEAVRTAVGKRNGSLAGVHPIDLGVAAFHGLFERVDVDPAAIDDVIIGCVDAIGGQAGNIGRNAWLAAAEASQRVLDQTTIQELLEQQLQIRAHRAQHQSASGMLPARPAF